MTQDETERTEEMSREGQTGGMSQEEKERAKQKLMAEVDEIIAMQKPKKLELDFGHGMVFGMILATIAIVVMYLFIHGGFRKDTDKVGAEVLTSASTLRKLGEIEEMIESSFLYEVDGEKLIAYLFKGMTIGLNDPYANYYTEEEIKSIAELNEGEYYGIGVNLLQDGKSGEIWIAGIYEGSPAWRAGIKTDDQIIKVNGENVTGWDLSAVVAKVKEKEETSITVLRDGEERVFTMTLTDVEIPTVSWEMMEDEIGYLKIAEFDTITVEQFEDAISKLQEQGMERLIVDVRDNPGGTLDSVCDILDDLLTEGLIVAIEDKDGYRQEFESDAERIYDGPLTVLVNGNSASASEIFAGTIQDYELGPVIGTTTYGKGVVQRTYLLSDGSALKLTAEKYYTAKGQDIDGNGITPDYLVEEAEEDTAEDLQLQRALEYLKG